MIANKINPKLKKAINKYGIDIYKKKSLVTLIRELSQIEGIEWIRLLYCYPEEIDNELIQELKTNPKVLKYLDIPLQHVSDKILKSMNRRSTHTKITELFTKLKNLDIFYFLLGKI